MALYKTELCKITKKEAFNLNGSYDGYHYQVRFDGKVLEVKLPYYAIFDDIDRRIIIESIKANFINPISGNKILICEKIIKEILNDYPIFRKIINREKL